MVSFRFKALIGALLFYAITSFSQNVIAPVQGVISDNTYLETAHSFESDIALGYHYSVGSFSSTTGSISGGFLNRPVDNLIPANLIGYGSLDGYIACYNGIQLRWAARIGSSNDDEVLDVVVGWDNNVYITEYYSG